MKNIFYKVTWLALPLWIACMTACGHQPDRQVEETLERAESLMYTAADSSLIL